MATLITSRSVGSPNNFDNSQSPTYDEFKRSRITEPFTEADYARLQNPEKKKFKELVSIPLFESKGIQIGEYFVFQISELKQLFEQSPEADFLHIHNTLDNNNQNFLYAIPVNSESSLDNKEIINEQSLLIGTVPCPPDPRCPK